MSYGHLILTRHQGEQITINLRALAPEKFTHHFEAQFIITTRKILTSQVTLGFFASKLVKIWRDEIWQEIAKEELHYRHHHYHQCLSP